MTKKSSNIWILNPTLRRQLTNKNDGTSKKLHSTDCKILETLCKHKGRTVSKSALTNAAWPGRVVSKASLTQSIAHLRIALGDNGREQNIIKTVPKHGYSLVEDLVEVEIPIINTQNSQSTDGPTTTQERLKIEVKEQVFFLKHFQNFTLLVLSCLLLLSITWLTQLIYYNSTTERIEWGQRDYLGVTYFFTNNQNGEDHFKAFKGKYTNNLRMLYLSDNPETFYISCTYQLNRSHVRNTMNMSFSQKYSIEQMKEVINEQCQ
ncbi:winged helix-turn-helix domain-containing protein [Vibrio splendidus]|uniref:winged helix-turn-helix domain-containing protein n=1 Tax=Vibrio splendidus TaxID=29497 RepID=UPI000304BCD5|nr:winged helix-turn-helix domain-containing protein [Vibrio splendidus]